MITATATTAKPSSLQKAGGIFGFLGLFAGLCTLFVFIVSVFEGWREHVQQSWPQVTARIQQCDVVDYDLYRASRHPHSFYIRCRITYEPGSEEIATRIQSRTAFKDIYVASMNDWVNNHEPGSLIVIRYDPANHSNAVLTETDMPFAGPHTPNNLRLLAVTAVACVLLLTASRILFLRRATSPIDPASPMR